MLPGITVLYRRTKTAPNPQDLSAFGVVMGYSSLGTRNVVATLGSLAACNAYGYGEGIEHAAEIGLNAGWPVYFCPVTGTPQAPGAVTKIPISAGVATVLYGSALAPGATPPTGGVLYVGKASGVSVVQVSGGANGVVVTGPAGSKVVTVTYAPAATNATIAGVVNADATAFALLSASPVGGSGAVTALASTSLDNGALTATPLDDGVSVSIVYSGTATPLSIPTVVGKAVVINGATDANGLPASTAASIVTYLNTNVGAGAIAARALLQLVAGGTGLGLAAAKSTTALQFGSTGDLTAGGTGNDDYDFVVTVATAGVVGGSPAPAITWSADNGALTSSRTLVPGTGEVALLDGFVNTGVTITLTGALEVGDVFTFSVAKPVVAFADMLTALAAVISDTSRRKGYVTSPTVVTRTQAAQLDTMLQAVATKAYLRGYFNVRDIADGVSNETEAQWINSLNAEFNGFVSAKGLLRIPAGHYSHISGYSLRIYNRPIVLLATGRKSLQAMHQSLAETAMGPLPRIRYLVDETTGVVTDPGIKHDENKLPGLDDERFITTRTFDVKGDGEQYLTSSPTMADPSDTGHALIMYVDVLMEAARTAALAAFPYIEKPAEGIAVAESAQVPKGAISQADADAISSEVGGAVDALLFKPKTDNLPSASRLPPDVQTITVLRNYSYITTRELRMELRVIPLGYSSFITIGVTLELP